MVTYERDGEQNVLTDVRGKGTVIDFQQVCKSYGTQDVLLDASFRVNDGERVGIVGPNGAGKSTIFGLIVDDVTPDRGAVTLPRDCLLGYLRQHLNPHDVDATLLQYTADALPEAKEVDGRIHELEAAMPGLDGRERERAIRELGELQTRFEAVGGYDLRRRAEKALSGLGFEEESFGRPFREFSGGWQMRAELARTIVARPSLLLLDEPSNYLDIPAVEWLQRFLRDFHGTLLLISHDRYLLNSLTTSTLEVVAGRVTRYPGNYDYYVRERETRVAQQLAARKNQDRKREQLERFVDRFRAKNTKASQVQSRIKQLEKMEEVEVLAPVATSGRIRLRPPPHCGHEIVRLDNAGYTYDGSRWVLRHVDLRIERGEKIALVGLNGMGKTTLLRVLGGALAPSEGKRFPGHRVVPGYQSQEFAETMPPAQTAFQVVKSAAADSSEGEIRTLLGGFGFSGEAIDKPVAVLSGGEKVRLAFARLLANPPNFLLLDEPTTHLDIAAREALESALADYKGTLCLVSHDIEFVRHVATGVVAMQPPGIRRYWGGYDYYHEKRDQELSRREAVSPRPARASGTTRKDERRARAKRVQAYARERRAFEEQAVGAESRIDALESEQARLLEEIGSSPAPDRIAEINRRLSAIRTDVTAATNAWERAADALEALRREFEDGAGE
jgi:ATP-binding cassette subfamily F protein 3